MRYVYRHAKTEGDTAYFEVGFYLNGGWMSESTWTGTGDKSIQHEAKNNAIDHMRWLNGAPDANSQLTRELETANRIILKLQKENERLGKLLLKWQTGTE